MSERRFKLYTIEQFEEYIRTVPVTRAITNVQIHHTAVPSLKTWAAYKDKEAGVRSMWQHHVNTKGMQDIAQHFTVAPEGLWDGRPLSLDSGGFKANYKGVNQNIGSICLEMVGYYDIGQEVFAPPVSTFAIRAVAAIKKRWPKVTIRFHRDEPGAGKTCPGTAISKPWFEAQVAECLKPKPVTPCDALYGLGVPFDHNGWNIKCANNKALESTLDAIADNWDALQKVPYFGVLLNRIADKFKK